MSRNTPTCVGKTFYFFFREFAHKKHPHVRGEDFQHGPVNGLFLETPPRAWGRPTPGGEQEMLIRNTPTCVGKTGPRNHSSNIGWKHPHVRGEDFRLELAKNRNMETPPRAWGRRQLTVETNLESRNTPTCVGKTCLMWTYPSSA